MKIGKDRNKRAVNQGTTPLFFILPFLPNEAEEKKPNNSIISQ